MVIGGSIVLILRETVLQQRMHVISAPMLVHMYNTGTSIFLCLVRDVTSQTHSAFQDAAACLVSASAAALRSM